MNVALPIPEKALADCGAILGRRGAGKSATGRVLLEHDLDAGHRCCVIDPKGDWYGIGLKKLAERGILTIAGDEVKLAGTRLRTPSTRSEQVGER